MVNVVVLQSLKECAVFKGLEDPELDILSELFKERNMEEGTTVFLENMPGESLYILRAGAVQISKMIAEGEEKTLVVLGPEEVFGEMALLDGEPRSATARVVERAHLLSLAKRDFESLCAAHPALALKLTRTIVRMFSRRVRENSDEYREMLAWSLDEQV